QTEQTASLERPHPERPGEGQRLRKPRVGGIEELARSRDLGLQAQRPRFVTPLAAMAGLLQRVIRLHRRFVGAPREQQRLAKRGQPPAVAADVADTLGLLHGSTQDRQALPNAPREGVRVAERRREPRTVDGEFPATTDFETPAQRRRGFAEATLIEMRTTD